MKFKISVPVICHFEFEVDAENEESALDMMPEELPYDSVGGAVAAPRGSRLTFGGRDGIMWDRSEILDGDQ